MYTTSMPDLQNFVNRIKTFTKMKETHPERAEWFDKKIMETKEYILDTLIQNDGNPNLEKIIMKHSET